MHRQTDDICLYVITPEGTGFYSFVEATDDSNKRPSQTVLCVLEEANGQRFEGHTLKCALKTMKLVAENGAKVFTSLEDLATYLNGLTKQNQDTSASVKIRKESRNGLLFCIRKWKKYLVIWIYLCYNDERCKEV